MEFTADPALLLTLAAVALLAGFVDTLAGGGGLITIPTLMLTPMAPIQVLATNKLQGTFGSLTATLTLLRKRQMTWADIRLPCLGSFIGAVVGAGLVQWVDTAALQWLVPVVLGLIAVYFLFAPSAGHLDRKPRIGAPLHRWLVVPAIGFYDGFFGPGTGSFFSLSEVALRGRNLIRATANAKAMNFASNAAALMMFILGGKIVWLVGLAMGTGQLLGAYLGSLAVVGGGARLIRPVIVLVCFAMLGRYLHQTGYL